MPPSSGYIGADPENLDLLAKEFDRVSVQVRGIHGQVLAAIRSSTWNGGDLDAFMREWQGHANKKLSGAASLLAASAGELRKQAEAQRLASAADGPPARGASSSRYFSGGGGGGGGVGGWGDEPDLSLVQAAEDVLDKFGLGKDALDLLKKALRDVDPQLLKDLGKFLAQNPAIIDGIKAFGKVLDLADVAVSFVKDWLTHASLPLDERLVHASVIVGIGALKSKGVEWVTAKLGAMVAGAAFPGAGHLAGGLVGFAVGTVVKEGVDYMDDRYDISTHLADSTLDVYRDAKHGAEAVGKWTGDRVDDVKDGAEWVGTKVLDGADVISEKSEQIRSGMMSLKDRYL